MLSKKEQITKRSKHHICFVLVGLMLIACIIIIVIIHHKGEANLAIDEIDISLFQQSPPLRVSSILANVHVEFTSIDKENGRVHWRMTNYTNQNLSYGPMFSLEFLHDGHWYVVPLRDGVAFLQPVYTLYVGDSFDFDTLVTFHYYPFPKAELYRIRQQIIAHNYQDYPIYPYPYSHHHDLIVEFQW